MCFQQEILDHGNPEDSVDKEKMRQYKEYVSNMRSVELELLTISVSDISDVLNGHVKWNCPGFAQAQNP